MAKPKRKKPHISCAHTNLAERILAFIEGTGSCEEDAAFSCALAMTVLCATDEALDDVIRLAKKAHEEAKQCQN